MEKCVIIDKYYIRDLVNRELDLSKISDVQLRMVKKDYKYGLSKYGLLLMDERLYFKAPPRCPFCGEELIITSHPRRFNCGFTILCEKCGFNGWDAFEVWFAESPFKDKGFRIPIGHALNSEHEIWGEEERVANFIKLIECCLPKTSQDWFKKDEETKEKEDESFLKLKNYANKVITYRELLNKEV